MKFEIELPFFEHTLTADVPSTWNDMTPAQVAHLLNIFALPVQWAETREGAFRWKQMQIMKALTNWTDEDLAQWQSQHFAEDFEMGAWAFLEDVVNVCNQLTEQLAKQTEEINWELVPNLTKNPYPKIDILIGNGKVKTFHAAKSSEESPFDTLNLDELSRIFTYWEMWRDEGLDEHFDMLLAVLYRPKKSLDDRLKKNYDGDIRKKLEQDDEQIEKRAKLFGQHVSDNFRKVIDFHIASCREHIAAMYPSVFSRKNELPNTGNTGDWLDLIIALADDNFGKKETIMRSNAHDSLSWADRIREKSKKQLTSKEQ